MPAAKNIYRQNAYCKSIYRKMSPESKNLACETFASGEVALET